MIRKVLRYEIRTDDQQHEIPAGKVVHMCGYRMKGITKEHSRVEVWVEAFIKDVETFESIGSQMVQIYGTGQTIPGEEVYAAGQIEPLRVVGPVHLASCLDGPFVWHLYQMGELNA